MTLMNQYGVILGLLNQNCNNSLKLYDEIMTLQDEVLKSKVRNSQLEDEIERCVKSNQELEEELKRSKEERSLLKCKNSRLFQEISFLKAKAGQGRDYMTLHQEQILKENATLKSVLDKTVPHNSELTQSLSFYKIQYHLLKKKFANLSTVTQQKNMKALEESLAEAQRQLLESEAYQHYTSLGSLPARERILLEEICECKSFRAKAPEENTSVFAYEPKSLEIRNLASEVEDLTTTCSNLKSKLKLSKQVIINYEKTIEKLHRELEYYKTSLATAGVGDIDQKGEEKGKKAKGEQKGRAREDRNVVERLLKDVESLNEIIRVQNNEIALTKFENDKLLNLYQNKEKILSDKRDQLSDLQSNYDELLSEKEYIEQQYLNSTEDPTSQTNEEQLLYYLIQSLQKERNEFKSKFKTAEKDLARKNIESIIMEEKEHIWKREREYYIKQQALIRSELEASKDVIIRMEGHINSLNVLLLPADYVQRLSILNTYQEYDSDLDDNSDSSFDDMMKGYGVNSAMEKVPKSDAIETTEKLNIPYINHLDFLDHLKLIRDSKRDIHVLRKNNEVITREAKLNNQIISHLAGSF